MAPEFLPGNRLTLLRSGTEYFPALEAAIGAARSEILLETYIYAADGTGERITRALCAAAERGVAVRVLVDGFGSRDFPRKIARSLRAAGAKLLVYRPEAWNFRFRSERLRRMHRKLAVIDGAVAFVGGINIIDDRDTPHPVSPRYDYAVKVEGPLLASIQHAAILLWNRIAWRRLDRGLRVSGWIAPEIGRRGPQRAAFVTRDNFRHRRDIENAYLAAIASAQQEIIIASAYFFPGARFRRALVHAAARGVRVVLLLQGRVEYVLLHYASRALYGTLLEAGVEIYEYHKSFMHAKVAVVDGYWATIGSSNIDPFSLLLAREANVMVEDRRFAARLRNLLRADMQTGARLIVKTSWFELPLWRRVPIWVGYGLSRFLMGMVGVGGPRY
ncbi:MAG: cardiolipin synthase ClsB [Burkholderiales bacterium]